MATGNMHKKLGEVRLRGFRVMQAGRQTDKQTAYPSQFTILHNPTKAK